MNRVYQEILVQITSNKLIDLNRLKTVIGDSFYVEYESDIDVELLSHTGECMEECTDEEI